MDLKDDVCRFAFALFDLLTFIFNVLGRIIVAAVIVAMFISMAAEHVPIYMFVLVWLWGLWPLIVIIKNDILKLHRPKY